MDNEEKDSYIKIKSKSEPYEYFSKGILSSSLFSIGINPNLAYDIAVEVEQEISKIEEPVSKKRLINIIAEKISHYDTRLAERYKIYEGSGAYKPIIILLAGVPGIGKSTLASQLSQYFEITGIIGTDMIREILRQTISPKLVPEIHCSSYEAYKHIRSQLNPLLRQSIIGYEEQSRHVIVGVEAAIQSALYMRQNMIIEGVHLSPNILNQKLINDPHVLFLMLHLKDEEEHLKRFIEREHQETIRKAKKYVESFTEIRHIQNYLLEESVKANVPIIETQNNELALKELTNLIWDRIIELHRATEKQSNNQQKR